MTIQNINITISLNKQTSELLLLDTFGVLPVIEEDIPIGSQTSVTSDGYFVSVFLRTLEISPTYRLLVLNYIKNISNSNHIKLRLKHPKKDIIDYGWNYRLERLLMERIELDNAMSWLSTLGGAFSALGDYFDRCAKIAAKISYQQFNIAMRLGEPPLVARCRLYLALSLIQQNKLKLAKSIVLEQYELSKLLKDKRLQNICHGIWAKLKYVNKLRKNGQ